MKHKLLTLASAAALLAACSDSSVSDANDEIKDKATVTFMVVDYNTNLPIEDAAVYFRPTDDTQYTDSTGTSVWTGVELGSDIYWDFTAKDYARKRFTYTLKDHITNDVARVDDLHPRINMYKLGVNVKGQFFYTDIETGNKVPAEGVTIYAKYTGDKEIYPNEEYTTTKEGGFYEFKNLASDVEITVKSERFTLKETNIVYDETEIQKFTQRKGEAKEVIKELDPKAAAVVGLKPVLLSSNLKKIDSTTAIQLTFSEVLEKDSVKTKHIGVKNANDNEIATVVTLDSEGKVVTIKPASGKWVDGNDYKLFFSVWSKAALEDDDKGLDPDDKSDDGIREFSVGTVKIPAKAENVKLDTAKNKDIVVSFYGERTYATLHDDVAANDTIKYSAVVNLIWKEVAKGVKGFNIYAMGDNADNADFTFVTTVGASAHAAAVDIGTAFGECYDDDGDDKTPDVCRFDYPLNSKEVKTVKIIVLPFNSAGEADASKATVVTAKVGDAAKSKMNGYENASVKSMESIDAVAFACTDEAISSCGASATKAEIKGWNDGDFFALDLSVEFTANKNDGAAGYTAYYKSGSKYVEIPVSGDVISSNHAAEGPFKENAVDYKARGSVDIEIDVVPYFLSADKKKISSTTLSKAVKRTTTARSLLNDLTK